MLLDRYKTRLAYRNKPIAQPYLGEGHPEKAGTISHVASESGRRQGWARGEGRK